MCLFYPSYLTLPATEPCYMHECLFPYDVVFEGGGGGKAGAWPESIERFIEGQASLLSYAPPPPTKAVSAAGDTQED